MQLISFDTSYVKSKFWRWKGVWNAMVFAFKYPRHVQLGIEIKEDGWTIHSNYSGINDQGHMQVLKYVGKEVEMMQRTENDFKDLFN